jgi:hypothetical protein
MRELRVVDRAVIALAIVLPDQLPIRPLDDRRFERYLGLLEPVRTQIGLELRGERLKVRGDLAQTDPDIPPDSGTVHSPQTVLAAIELLTHVAHGNQLAVQPIAPLMVRAYQARRVAVGLPTDTRATMST